MWRSPHVYVPLLAVAAATTAAGCDLTQLFPAIPTARRGGAGVVSAKGSVGPLRIDRSTPAEIEPSRGHPSTSAWAGSAR